MSPAIAHNEANGGNECWCGVEEGEEGCEWQCTQLEQEPQNLVKDEEE